MCAQAGVAGAPWQPVCILTSQLCAVYDLDPCALSMTLILAQPPPALHTSPTSIHLFVIKHPTCLWLSMPVASSASNTAQSGTRIKCAPVCTCQLSFTAATPFSPLFGVHRVTTTPPCTSCTLCRTTHPEQRRESASATFTGSLVHCRTTLLCIQQQHLNLVAAQPHQDTATLTKMQHVQHEPLYTSTTTKDPTSQTKTDSIPSQSSQRHL